MEDDGRGWNKLFSINSSQCRLSWNILPYSWNLEGWQTETFSMRNVLSDLPLSTAYSGNTRQNHMPHRILALLHGQPKFWYFTRGCDVSIHTTNSPFSYSVTSQITLQSAWEEVEKHNVATSPISPGTKKLTPALFFPACAQFPFSTSIRRI